MKRVSIVAACLLVAGVVYAQQTTTPRSTTGTRLSNPDNSTGVHRTNPMPGQTSPVQEPGQLKTSNPFGSQTTQPTGTEPTVDEPYNDYHLTRPSTSPTPSNVVTPSVSDDRVDYNEDLIRLERNQIPNTMIDALQDPMYRGWEASDMFLDPRTNEYYLDINTDDKTRRYRFDRRGNPVEINSVEDDDLD
ncbi:MAG TPA: hypothetical protein VD927_02000 [Chryseosolibacter sp.]|nr:hypothetical protein [Chryseosolibacter sp.]